MAYAEVFGGELIFPSQTSYLAITTSVDVTLQWPIEQQIAGIDVVADFMDITASIGGLNIDMPDARQASTGQKVLFNNPGANLYTVRDDTGGTIQTVAIGEQWVFVLTDNTTQAGTWLTFQMGATVSSATAGSLTGAGIKAISTTLNQMIESNVEAATPFTVVDADRATCLIYTTGSGTCNLPSPAAVGDDWFFMLRNSGTGTLNIVPPSGLIDDAASINLDPNDSCFIFTDGTDFFTVGLSVGSVIAFDFVSIAIPGSGDFTLSGANLNRISYRFTGLLTGDRKIVVPGTTQQYWVDNQTTGGFALTIGTSAQVGEPAITQGLSEIFYCDGVDVVSAVSASTIAVPVTIAQGGTGATTLGGAQTNLQIPLVLDDLSDVTITAPVTDGILIKSAGDWIDTDQLEVDIAGGENRFRILGTLALTINNFGVEYSIQKDAFHFYHLNNINAGWEVTVGTAAALGTVFFRQLSGAGALQDTWMEMRRFGEVALFENDVEVFRTLAPGLGGAEANNTLTGAGFERVLTVGDLDDPEIVVVNKILTTSRNTDIVPSADPDLQLSLGIGTWHVVGWIGWFESSGNSQGLQMTFQSIDAGVMSGLWIFEDTSDVTHPATPRRSWQNTNVVEDIINGDASPRYAKIDMYLNVTVAGTLAFLWAQSASNASNTNVLGTPGNFGSTLIATKVS